MRLRKLCGPYLFRFKSLVRGLGFDPLVVHHTTRGYVSNGKRYQRKMKKEIHRAGFRICSDAELAKLSISSSVNCNAEFISRHQSVACCNFVTQLEIGNDSLKYGCLRFFPHLSALSVLDEPLDGPYDSAVVAGPLKLASLLVSFQTLLYSEQLRLLLPSVQRLDTIIDDSVLGGRFESDLSILHVSLRELNVFVSDAEVLSYGKLIGLLTQLVGPSLESISFRVVKQPMKYGEVNGRYLLPLDIGPPFVAVLQQSPILKHVTMDFSILNRLLFPRYWEVSPRKYQRGSLSGSVLLTFIDYAHDMVKNIPQPEFLANIVHALAVTEIVFVHGQLTYDATGWMRRLLRYLALASRRAVPYDRVRKLSMEEAWSGPDYRQLQRNYQRLLNKYQSAPIDTLERFTLIDDICTFVPYGRLPFRPALNRVHYKV